MRVRAALAAVVVSVLTAVTTAVGPAQAATLYDQDFDGDGAPDIVAAHDNGRLYLFPGDGDGGWRRSPIKLGQGWTYLDQVHLAGDWNGDGTVDIVARNVLNGQLLLYPGNGRGGLLPTRTIGSGWLGFSDLAFPGDWSGDGEEDAVAVRRGDGALMLYPGDGRGGWLAPRQIGSGWHTRDLLTAVGDWTGDGNPDLMARSTDNGTMLLYQGDGRGGFAGSRVIGTGWGTVTAALGPGDFNGDGANDVLARDSQGRLVLYRGNGQGGFAGRPYPVVGTGWEDLLLNERTRVPERVVLFSATGMGAVRSDVDAFARHVDWTLNDFRGWSLGHDIRFDRVEQGGELRLYLATPAHVAAAGCADTVGCRVGNRVYVNDEQWQSLPSTYADASLDDYRHYLVNHPVGYWFGLDEADCPGLRRLAPVMQEQSSSLDLCRPNPWPLEEEKDAARDRAL